MADVQKENEVLQNENVEDNLAGSERKEDVKESFRPSVELIEKWIKEDNDGQALLSRLTDKRVSQSIETYKNNHLEEIVKSRVEKEIRSRYPDETEEQKRLRAIENELEQSKREAHRGNLVNHALKLAQDKNLGKIQSILHLVKDTDTKEDIESKILLFKEDMDFIATQAVNQVLAGKGKAPMSGDGEITFTMDEIKKMSPEQYAKNRDAIQAFLESRK